MLRENNLSILKRILYLLPAVICMMVIFSFSAKTGGESGGESSAIVRAFMEMFIPGVDGWDVARRAEVANVLEVGLRKMAHATEFALLEALLAFGLYKGRFIKLLRKAVLVSMAIATVYACSDEIHQLFVPGRSGQVTDVLIDFLGICVAAGVFGMTLRG